MRQNRDNQVEVKIHKIRDPDRIQIDYLKYQVHHKIIKKLLIRSVFKAIHQKILETMIKLKNLIRLILALRSKNKFLKIN